MPSGRLSEACVGAAATWRPPRLLATRTLHIAACSSLLMKSSEAEGHDSKNSSSSRGVWMQHSCNNKNEFSRSSWKHQLLWLRLMRWGVKVSSPASTCLSDEICAFYSRVRCRDHISSREAFKRDERQTSQRDAEEVQVETWRQRGREQREVKGVFWNGGFVKRSCSNRLCSGSKHVRSSVKSK